MMRKEEVEDAPNVMTGNFSIRTHLVGVLFDSVATHSFISARLVDTLRIALTSRHFLLSITLLDGKVVRCQELFTYCPILIHSQDFLADLYQFKLTEFDVILGID